MSLTKIIGILLIVAGGLGLVFTSFSYTKDEHEAKLGPVSLSVKEKETVNVPTWASVVAIVVGGALLIAGARKR